MKRWTWIMALMLALMIPLQGCTSDTPKDGGEEQNQQEQQEAIQGLDNNSAELQQLNSDIEAYYEALRQEYENQQQQNVF